MKYPYQYYQHQLYGLQGVVLNYQFHEFRFYSPQKASFHFTSTMLNAFQKHAN